jgi:uncharacterized protein (TIGR00661 family)
MHTINNKTILFSPLDWGFGHTTRSVSLIQTLLNQGNQIIFAGNNQQISFIKKEFPSIKSEYIDGYNVYLSSKKSTYWQLGKQLNSILNSIKKEILWVDNYISKHQVDLIISDNRYGFRNPKVKSIFMGHQLNVYVPKFRVFINKKLSQYINLFTECWIVDDKTINLTGELSDPKYLSIPYQYIGLLNRFKREEIDKIFDYLIIVSGAHPENKIFLKQVEDYFIQKKTRVVIVSTVESEKPIKNGTYYYYPTTLILNQLINQSNVVVSKLGYTTLMEMVVLKKKCYLIPTKGQFEQEYLSQITKSDCVVIIKSINTI